MIVRAMTAADLGVVAQIDAEVFGGTAWSAAAWAEEFAASSAQRRYIVAEAPAGNVAADGVAGPVAGYAGVLLAGSDADVLTLAVSPGHRRAGVGSRLLAELVAIAARANAQSIFLEVAEGNAAAIGLYEGEGFSVIGARRHYYGTGRHAVTMQRRLREPMGSRLLGEGA